MCSSSACLGRYPLQCHSSLLRHTAINHRQQRRRERAASLGFLKKHLCLSTLLLCLEVCNADILMLTTGNSRAVGVASAEVDGVLTGHSTEHKSSQQRRSERPHPEPHRRLKHRCHARQHKRRVAPAFEAPAGQICCAPAELGMLTSSLGSP